MTRLDRQIVPRVDGRVRIAAAGDGAGRRSPQHTRAAQE
jgi:hypothetical protein